MSKSYKNSNGWKSASDNYKDNSLKRKQVRHERREANRRLKELERTVNDKLAEQDEEESNN